MNNNIVDKKIKSKIESYYSKVSKAVAEYDLIEEGDKILVGVSGGIDSLCLLKILATRLKYSKSKYQIVACYINVLNNSYITDIEYIKSFCKELDVVLHIEDVNLKLDENYHKSFCFICSWQRRKRLFELCVELQCNKLALGHHLDDAIETLLINMCYHGTISSIPAKLSMFGGKIVIIRPLILLTKKDIDKFTSLNALIYPKSSCIHEAVNNRKQAADIISYMEKYFKNTRKGMFNSMSKIYLSYLPHAKNNNPIISGLNAIHEDSIKADN